MKVLVLDNDGEGCGVDIALRADAADHTVRYWVPAKAGPYADGMLTKVVEWEPSMEWADLIILTGNSKYEEALVPYFGKGYPIFGTNSKSAELELDRSVGQEILKEYGIAVLPYHTVDDLDDAIKLVAKTNKAYAIKPWGGTADKSMTCVARDANDAIFMLERWKAKGLKGQLMLQEKADGVEVGISGFFGPGGWSEPKEESFEHKKFLNDDLGCNTGEMGTVIRHVSKSKLFDQILDPLTEYLHQVNYVGDCSVNCIVDDDGNPWPLEFTMRLGWPDFCIRQSLIQSDPVEWMVDLLHGKDTLQISEEIAVGVALTHGDFPATSSTSVPRSSPEGTCIGYPLHGVEGQDNKAIQLQEVMYTEAPMLVGGKVVQKRQLLTAGNFLLVCSGTGATVRDAQERAYGTAWSIKSPSNLMFRTDIGDRLKKDLPKLQKHGYAKGMKWD